MAQYHVRLENLNMQGDKLFMRAEAPSADAKNKVWDEIKRIDPNYSDDSSISAGSSSNALYAAALMMAPEGIAARVKVGESSRSLGVTGSSIAFEALSQTRNADPIPLSAALPLCASGSHA